MIVRKGGCWHDRAKNDVEFAKQLTLSEDTAKGVAPAFHCSRLDMNRLLREGGRGTSGSRGRQRLTSVLVVAQVSCTIVLLIGFAAVVIGLRRRRTVATAGAPLSAEEAAALAELDQPKG